MAARMQTFCLRMGMPQIWQFYRPCQHNFKNIAVLNRLLCSHVNSTREKCLGDLESVEVKEDVNISAHLPPKTRNKPARRKDEPEPSLRTSPISSPLTQENQFDVMASYVTPLWRMPYEEQLKLKQRRIEVILSALGRRLRDNDSRTWSHAQRLPCPVDRIRSAPTAHLPYRNKDDFSINRGIDGNPKTIGMYVGSHVDPNGVVCVPPDQLVITRDSHKLVARLFQEYIRSSPLSTCLQLSEGGHWRNVRMRSNMAGDLMVVIIIHRQQLSEDSILDEKNRIKEFFTTGPGKECGIKSLYFQTCSHTRCTHEQSPFQLLHGEPHIVETLGSLRFQISPDSFFQTNTDGAGVLYETLLEYSHMDKNVGLLDVCCGTGTISLFLANHVHETIGMDVTKQVILDAKFNAKLNGINNASFYTGRAEDLIGDCVKSFGRRDIVAVVNPSRGGLNHAVIHGLRKSNRVYQVLYVSCSPEGTAMNDFARLCHPTDKNYSGKPFQLRRAVPVDMFPHTDHCEVILSFDRG